MSQYLCFGVFGGIPLSFMTSSFPGLFLGKMSKKKPWERGCNSGTKKKCPQTIVEPLFYLLAERPLKVNFPKLKLHFNECYSNVV